LIRTLLNVEQSDKPNVEADSLNPKQEAFCQEYLKDLNATQAAIRAGYSADSARQIGSENLSKPAIEARLKQLMDERSERTRISADRVLNELAKLAFSDMRNFAKWGPGGVHPIEGETLSDEDAACVAEVSETTTKDGGSIRFKLHDKKAALELLGRHLKLFTDKQEVSGPNGQPIQMDLTHIPQDALDAEFQVMLARAMSEPKSDAGS
jgi:phage terminase small subunit